MYIGQASHVGIVIILLILLKAQIVNLFGWKASIIILERILNIKERLPKSSTRKKLGVPYPPEVKHITEPVYKNCDD
jgi:hypothetical protein